MTNGPTKRLHSAASDAGHSPTSDQQAASGRVKTELDDKDKDGKKEKKGKLAGNE